MPRKVVIDGEGFFPMFEDFRGGVGALGLAESFEDQKLVDGAAGAFGGRRDFGFLFGCEGLDAPVEIDIGNAFLQDHGAIRLALHQGEDVIRFQRLVDEFDERAGEPAERGDVITDIRFHHGAACFLGGIGGGEARDLDDVERLNFGRFDRQLIERDSIGREDIPRDLEFADVAGDEGEGGHGWEPKIVLCGHQSAYARASSDISYSKFAALTKNN